MSPLPYLLHAIRHLKARLGEPSTWVAIGASVAAVSALAPPWSYIGLSCGVMAAMLPDQKPGQ